MYGKGKFPNVAWALTLAALVYTFLLSDNILLMIPVLLFIPFAYKLFFIKGNPNVIFWGLMYQWLNVSIHLIYCTMLGITLSDYFAGTIFPSDLMDYTAILSITGMYIFCLGFFVVVKKLKIAMDESEWEKYDPKKILQTYIIVSVIININQFAIWAFPSVVQYFYFFFYIKWGFFLVTFISIYKRAPHLKLLLYTVIAVEFFLGLSSYFASSFTYILMFSLIAFSSVSKKISFVKAGIFIISGAALFHLAVLWTAAKGNYRSYVSQGQNVQTVKVSQDEARKKLLELLTSIDPLTYERSVQELINRVGYIQYFAACIRFVPAKVPHQYGDVYLAAISHYLVPRFLNPDKPELDDSKHTNEFTGLNVSGKARASSFSLGTYADAYIDFGPYGMFVPIFLFGAMIGYFFKTLFRRGLWGLILTGPFFLLINIYGADTTKALGFVLIYFIVIYFVNRFLKSFIDPMMRPALKT